MLATILTFGLTMTTLTSCSDDDDTPAIKDTKLTGNWFAQITAEEKSSDGENYVLFSFKDDGLLVTNSYEIYPDEPMHWSERHRRHMYYTVNEEAGTFTMIDGEEESTINFMFNSEGMIISENKHDLKIQLHRPTASELKMLATFEKVISSDDYVGKWINEKNDGGVMTYTVLEIDENARMKSAVYRSYGDQSDCTTFEFIYGEYDTNEYQGKVLEIHSAKDYRDVGYWWWNVKDNMLSTGPADIENGSDGDEEEDMITYRPFTLADKELIDKRDKMIQ